MNEKSDSKNFKKENIEKSGAAYENLEASEDEKAPGTPGAAQNENEDVSDEYLSLMKIAAPEVGNPEAFTASVMKKISAEKRNKKIRRIIRYSSAAAAVIAVAVIIRFIPLIMPKSFDTAENSSYAENNSYNEYGDIAGSPEKENDDDSQYYAENSPGSQESAANIGSGADTADGLYNSETYISEPVLFSNGVQYGWSEIYSGVASGKCPVSDKEAADFAKELINGADTLPDGQRIGEEARFVLDALGY